MNQSLQSASSSEVDDFLAETVDYVVKNIAKDPFTATEVETEEEVVVKNALVPRIETLAEDERLNWGDNSA
ncbi:hypothetical protein CVT24_012216 [Panaeolus cyanescens]|uniref:Uncharacterized protein n=1 Tax=Panaeolus cyanescens TaxID=181874 RepID=A0A409YIP8_9AGAR|nr:hypothetical protein CVT24_012216 [Panaeolus cyanescens]